MQSPHHVPREKRDLFALVQTSDIWGSIHLLHIVADKTFQLFVGVFVACTVFACTISLVQTSTESKAMRPKNRKGHGDSVHEEESLDQSGNTLVLSVTFRRALATLLQTQEFGEESLLLEAIRKLAKIQNILKKKNN